MSYPQVYISSHAIMSGMAFSHYFPDTVINYFPDHGEGSGILKYQKAIPDNYGSFFTVNGCKDGTRRKDHLTSLNGIHTDIDSKDRTKEELLMETGEYALPSLINETKNGFHLIWLFKIPVTPTKETIAQLEGMNRRVRELFGGDKAATDAVRLLRIPGSYHKKDPQNAYLITNVYNRADDLEERYTFEEYLQIFPPVMRERTDYVESTSIPKTTRGERLQLMLQKPEIKALYNGDTSVYIKDGKPDYSSAEMALVSSLTFWLGHDREAVRDAWLSSPLGSRDKTQQRRGYQDMTIDKAFNTVTDVYTPPLPKVSIPHDDGLEEEQSEEQTVQVSEPTTELREAYRAMKLEADWGDKEWVKRFMALQERYILDFHTYVGAIHPHLIYERNEDRVWWNYIEDEGIYEEITATTARTFVLSLLMQEELPHKATESFARDCLARYKAFYPKRGVKYDQFDQINDWFHARNGWLNLTTGEFEPHTPTRLSKRTSAVEYVEGATCPRYDRFLDQDVALTEDKVRVIDQFSGLSLTGDMRFQKMLTLIGRPGSGKSTLLEIWSYILGDCAVQKRLTDLTGDSFRFAGSSITGRSLCWFDEVDVKKTEMGNTLGTLITGEKINVERKGINNIIQARNTVKCVLTANTLPLSSEHGMYRRMIHIKFDRSFYDEGIVEPNLLQTLREEAPGILNRMIEGLRDLYAEGGFSYIEGHDEEIEEYKAQSNPVSEFLVEYFDPGDDEDTVTTGQLYEAFYSSDIGQSMYKLSPQKFGQMINTQPLKAYRLTTKKGSKGVRLWGNLRLKKEYYFDEFNQIKRVA